MNCYFLITYQKCRFLFCISGLHPFQIESIFLNLGSKKVHLLPHQILIRTFCSHQFSLMTRRAWSLSRTLSAVDGRSLGTSLRHCTSPICGGVSAASASSSRRPASRAVKRTSATSTRAGVSQGTRCAPTRRGGRGWRRRPFLFLFSLRVFTFRTELR